MVTTVKSNRAVRILLPVVLRIVPAFPQSSQMPYGPRAWGARLPKARPCSLEARGWEFFNEIVKKKNARAV